MIITDQDHSHCRTYSKCMENEYQFFYRRYLTKKVITGNPLDSKFSIDRKQGVLTVELLYKDKSHIILILVIILLIDPTNENFISN